MKNTHYDREYFEERDYLNLTIAESIQIFVKDHHLRTILDVGSGTGKLVHFLNKNGFDAYGCDNADIAIETAQNNNKKNTIIKAPAAKLPFKKNSFDIITAISLIEHLTKKEANAFILEAKRVLKPNGFIFIVTPNFASPWRFIQGKKWFGYSDPTHITFFTPRSLCLLLINNGFKNIKLWFKTSYNKKYDVMFPRFFSKLPVPIKRLGIYLLFSTPLSLVRDSFWIAAQKNE